MLLGRLILLLLIMVYGIMIEARTQYYIKGYQEMEMSYYVKMSINQYLKHIGFLPRNCAACQLPQKERAEQIGVFKSFAGLMRHPFFKDWIVFYPALYTNELKKQ